MPDAHGNLKGIALTGKAGDTLERIFPSTTPQVAGPLTEDAFYSAMERILHEDADVLDRLA